MQHLSVPSLLLKLTWTKIKWSNILKLDVCDSDFECFLWFLCLEITIWANVLKMRIKINVLPQISVTSLLLKFTQTKIKWNGLFKLDVCASDFEYFFIVSLLRNNNMSLCIYYDNKINVLTQLQCPHYCSNLLKLK